MSNNESKAWDEKYYTSREYQTIDDFLLFSHTNPTLLEIEKYVRESSQILEIGSGTGELISYLKVHYPFINAYGVDYSLEAITRSKKVTEEFDISINFKNADIKQLPFKNDFFDIIFGDHVIGHIDDIDAALKEILRVLKKGGVAAFSIGNSLRPDGWFLYKKISDKHTGYRQRSMFPWTLKMRLRKAGFVHPTFYGDLIFLRRNVSIIKNRLKRKSNQGSREVKSHVNGHISDIRKLKKIYNYIEKHAPSVLKISIGIIVKK